MVVHIATALLLLPLTAKLVFPASIFAPMPESNVA